MTLLPRQRDNYSAAMQGANAEDHALAYLEHHRHGIEMIILFLTYAGLMKDKARRGFRIVVHS